MKLIGEKAIDNNSKSNVHNCFTAPVSQYLLVNYNNT